MSSVDSFGRLFPYLNEYLLNCERVLSLIGLYFVAKISAKLLYKLLNQTYIHIWSQLRPIRFDSVNKWALISDANNEVGFAFAQELARKGLNLIIIGADKDKLLSIYSDISFKYNVEVMTIGAHFSKDIGVYDMIGEEIAGKEILVLVNNVSVTYETPKPYLELRPEKVLEIINSNISPVLMMTHLVLPEMVSRKSGFIINISSLCSVKPIPQLSAYSASKAFVDHFSRGLSYEYKSKGITIQSLMPSYVYSPFSKYSQKLGIIPLMVPSCETYAKFAVNTIGFTNRTTGYIPHEFQFFLLSLIPERFWYFISWYSLRLLTLYCI